MGIISVYNLTRPDLFVKGYFTVIFKEGKVLRILEGK
jgi:hypothetical protein